MTTPEAVGVEQALRSNLAPGCPRRWPGTAGALVLTPLVMVACGWLAQRQGTLLVLLATFLALVVLFVVWAMCGAGLGACVAALGFALMLFTGPALNDYVLGQRGVHYEGVITGTHGYYRKHGEGLTCYVVRTDVAKSPKYSLGDSDGCDKSLRPGRRVVLVTDPDGWLAPRLSGSVNGLSSGMAWTCAGLFAAMEAFILYGRLRRRT
ncbi:hypothetical protein [Streptomyces sp. NPDC088725]|uniref:hypothetical protein n=1 Tax=Streptomyces sp. NPDC088725 TaxID=3365873 RepID=UPI0038139020